MKKVVAIGGGTGLSTLLKGLKKYSIHITAIVAVSDSGGSSGRLRKDYGVLPPGDIRNCIVALAEEELLMTKLVNFRFSGKSDIAGHSLGNLLLLALIKIKGSLPKAIKEISKILKVKGDVLPATLDQVNIVAETEEGKIVEGEVNIDLGTYKGEKKIKRIFLKPSNVKGYHKAIQAIQKADYILVGPGDLFTSILPNLLIKDLLKEIKKSHAFKIYICNVANKFTETHNFKASDYLRKIKEHLGENIFDIILVNNNFKVKLPIKEKHTKVKIDKKEIKNYVKKIYKGNLLETRNPLRHDSKKLAKILMKIINEN